ncbi:helical backbone metal receptor [Prolixibacteraceae bacterium Z1-6]|uniref:Helical backbone metal receptor n=1 Tax=Draconibacterium aestuarii TaxID=2998507 RepID=A0A9X3F2M2_9BACT|nr:helical backbone metal receptor [Prolixibacteraceae bacterium Z1-6]
MIKKILFGILLMAFTGIQAIAQKVERVVSLTPSITENIYMIGAQNKLVGCTSYCTEAVKDGVQQVGSTVEVNVEKVLAQQPDLVLAMELTKPQDIATIRKLGIKVEIIRTPKNFDEICTQTLALGKLVGHSAEAEQVVQSAKTTVEAIRRKANKLDRSKIFFQIGAKPIFTVLENTFMNDFITLCNGENIAEGMTKGTITRESVLLKNPDVIVIAEMGGFGKDEQKVWYTYESISAVKNNKVFLISSETSCSPTPANFVSALQDVYQFVSE